MCSKTSDRVDLDELMAQGCFPIAPGQIMELKDIASRGFADQELIERQTSDRIELCLGEVNHGRKYQGWLELLGMMPDVRDKIVARI